MADYPKLTFKYGWDDRDDEETPMKGYRSDGIVQSPKGEMYPGYFVDLAKAALETQLASGEIVTIEVGKERSQQQTDPWLKHMGIFASDPTFDDFLAEVAAYRQQVSEQEVFE